MKKDDVTNLKIDLNTLSVDEFIARMGDGVTENAPAVPVDLNGKRFAYTIVVEQTDEEGNYIPCIAVENEQGYYPMTGQGPCSAPWTWGKDYEKACQAADAMNAKMGLSLEDSFRIVTSSMFGPRS